MLAGPKKLVAGPVVGLAAVLAAGPVVGPAAGAAIAGAGAFAVVAAATVVDTVVVAGNCGTPAGRNHWIGLLRH